MIPPLAVIIDDGDALQQMVGLQTHRFERLFHRCQFYLRQPYRYVASVENVRTSSETSSNLGSESRPNSSPQAGGKDPDDCCTSCKAWHYVSCVNAVSDRFTIISGGRPRLLSNKEILVITLLHLRGLQPTTLAGLALLPRPTIINIIRHGLMAIHASLPPISWPSQSACTKQAGIIPGFENCIGFIDSTNIPVKKPESESALWHIPQETRCSLYGLKPDSFNHWCVQI